METGRLSVHTENILPIIKKWLYSEREIFLRELISNAFDAITKVKKIAIQEDIRDPEDQDFQINITIDRENKKLIIEDNGVGLTQDEIRKFITQIAFSGAEEFVKQYEESSDKTKAGIIGNFGLGFYSSFMVSRRVEIESLSWKPDATAAHWESEGNDEFQIGEGSREKRGTTITLHIDEDSQELLDLAKINELVRRYCDFLPVPIKVDGARVNRESAPWTEQPSQVKQEDYINLYKHLYPMQEDPLFHVHLNVDYPFQLQGILFFPKLAHEMDLNRSNVKIFCKQVFVTDEAQELIPRFLTVLQGVIDLPDLPLNVSRSYLQQDPQVKKIATHIIKKVADRLSDEYKNNRDNFHKIWPDIAPFVKYGMMNDDSFYEQAKSCLVFQVAEEEGRFVTIEEYQNKNKEKTENKIFYVNDPRSQAGPLKLLKDQGIEVLLMNQMIDSHFMQFLESKGGDFRFVRVDAEVSDQVVDKEGESKVVDAEGNDQTESLTELFKKALNNDQVTIRVEALKDVAMPAMILLPEHLRRFSEMSVMMNPGGEGPEFPDFHTLVLNSRNDIIQSLSKPALITGDNTTSKSELMAKHIYYLARIAQGGLSTKDLSTFLENAYDVLEKSV